MSYPWYSPCARQTSVVIRIEWIVLFSSPFKFSHSIDPSLFHETVSMFIKQGQINGSMKAGSFIPQRYEDQKNDTVVNFLRSNQYVTKKLLKDNRVEIFVLSHVDYFSCWVLLKARLFQKTNGAWFIMDKRGFNGRSGDNHYRAV